MDKYKILSKISNGAFGTVYNAQAVKGENNGLQVAIKQIYVSDLVKREIQILTEFKTHPNIIQVYEIVSQNEYEKSIVMEKGLMDLDAYIQSIQYPISEQIVKVVAKQMLQALSHLHKSGIIHRDLKPSNIMIKNDRMRVGLCDFGSAVHCVKEGEYAIQGFTRWYKSPQMLFGSRNYQYEVDVWSLGCILMELATGQQLFPGKTELQQISLISNLLGDPSPQNWPSIVKLHDYGKINFVQKAPKSKQWISKKWGLSLQLTQFLMKMIRYDNRPSSRELLQDQFLNFAQTNKQIFEDGPFTNRKITSIYFKH